MKLRIRQATVLDASAMAAMKAAAWREAYTGVVPEEVLAHEESPAALAATAERWEHSMAEGGAYYWLVVDDDADGEVVGLANAMPARDADAPTLLELTMIYLRERVKGTGVADALLLHAVGDADCCLWVLADNPRAHAFYRRHGFEPDGATKEQAVSTGDVLREVRMVRREHDDD